MSEKRLDPRFASISIERKDEEVGDKNFPPNLHAAMQLFLMCGRQEQAQRCGKIVAQYISVLEKGPDGKTSHDIGRACICWSCGHVGLPSNRSRCKKTGYKVLPICSACKEKDQTNFVKVVKSGDFVPWIEIKSKASKEAVAMAEASEKKVGRNDKCPCNSGKKYKKCCLLRKVKPLPMASASD